MRHNKKGTHLGKTTSHKKALVENMAASLIEHKSIKTTHAKAREVKRYVERLITYAKKGSLHHRRLAFKFLQNKAAVTELFDEIGPKYTERPGGYTRIIKLGFRKGDAAAISMLEFVDIAPKIKKEKKEKVTEVKKVKEKEAESSEVAS